MYVIKKKILRIFKNQAAPSTDKNANYDAWHKINVLFDCLKKSRIRDWKIR